MILLSVNKRFRFSRSPRGESGGVLLITILVAGLLGFALCSYMLMVRAESTSLVRSQAWNNALAMAGAGVEEALARLNPGANAPEPAAHGWTSGLRLLPDGAFSNSYNSAIRLEGFNYVIYSTGYVTIRRISASVSRVLRVTTTNAPLFSTALASRLQIDTANQGFSTYSTNWNSALRFNGNVACLFGFVNIRFGHIFGDVLLGSTAQLEEGTNQLSGGNSKLYTDFNSDFPDVTAPSTAGWSAALPPPYTNNLIRYDYGFRTPLYIQNTDVPDTAFTGQSLFVGTNVNVIIRTTGNTVISNLYVAGNGKITIYSASPNFTLNGKMTIESGTSTNFCYFGLQSNTNVAFNFVSTTNFFGTIYAPSATVTNNYSKNNTDNDKNNFIGSAVGRSLVVRGNPTYYFDEGLIKSGPRRGYVVTAWQEL